MQSFSDFGWRVNVMQFKFSIKPLGSRPVVAGTGLIALDIVIPTTPNSLPQLWAGGTCGNVLAALSFLGWESIPIARLSNDAASKQITQDLERWGVRLDYLGLDAHGSTPVIIQHIHCSAERGRTHSFSRKCPFCGKRLPWYKPVRVSDAVGIFRSLPSIDVFFFDRTSAGALYLARNAAEKGALVVFEPSASSGPNGLNRAMEVAHIVKYSRDRFSGLDEFAGAQKLPLLIETNGAEGLRFISRLPGGTAIWESSESFPAEEVVDTSGCGDWCTAGLVTMLGGSGQGGFAESSPQQVRRALRFGQALAAWNCGFQGARGGMYQGDESSLRDTLARLMAGTGLRLPEHPSEIRSYSQPTEYACVSCGGRAFAQN
jgi:sugar/nucleoside kinase (ribokinase family)